MINQQIGPYHIVQLPPARRVMIHMLDLSGQRRSMYGLLEVDVTMPRRFIADHKARTGESLSFTGFVTLCLARAVEEHKSVQSYLKGSNQLVLFDDVDVGLMIEREMGETRAPTGYVIRRANHKTYREIHEEIRIVQSTPVPSSGGMPSWFLQTMLLPWPLSRWVHDLVRVILHHNPTLGVSLAGMVGITSVGMFGEGHSGWGMFPVLHVLGLILGSIAWKPAIVKGRVEPREFLNLTVMFDHEVVDGAPAARFTRRLVELIESGYGLNEESTEHENHP